jgi:hypothetical protein
MSMNRWERAAGTAAFALAVFVAGACDKKHTEEERKGFPFPVEATLEDGSIFIRMGYGNAGATLSTNAGTGTTNASGNGAVARDSNTNEVRISMLSNGKTYHKTIKNS